MIGLTLLAAASATILGLSELPPQPEVAGHCRVFLWLKRQPPVRIAMVDEATRHMRLQSGKRSLNIPETAPWQFEGEGYRITINLEFAEHDGITNGAVIDSGSIRIEQVDPDNPAAQGAAMSFPAGGMRSCR